MICGIKFNVALLGRAILLILLSTAGPNIANAVSIPTGDSMGVGGAYTITGSLAGGDWTLDLGTTISGTGAATGVFAPLTFLDEAPINSTIDLDSFSPIPNLFTINGWQVDLQTMVIGTVGSTVVLDGTGFITGNGYDKTPAIWELTGNELGSTYSISLTTVVPVPAAVWLFGSGLLGLIAVARRKTT